MEKEGVEPSASGVQNQRSTPELRPRQNPILSVPLLHGSVLVCLLLWNRPGSNRRPPPCRSGALPAELRPHARRPDVDPAGTVRGDQGRVPAAHNGFLMPFTLWSS